jgi:hypothetical protein
MIHDRGSLQYPFIVDAVIGDRSLYVLLRFSGQALPMPKAVVAMTAPIIRGDGRTVYRT